MPESSDRETKIGNTDCKLVTNGKEFLDIVDEFVHAVRVEDDIRSIQRDTMYLYPNSGEANIHVVDSVNIDCDESTPNIYPELVSHMVPEPGHTIMYNELNGFKINPGLAMINGVLIKVNNAISGYYLPDLNSWILGNWSWHLHYVEILVKDIFPKIVSQIGISPCATSIAAERRGVTGNKKPRITVTIGCDPELEVTKNSRVVRADTNLGIRDYTSTEIGCDGASAQLEFRPKPGTPQQVVKNIRHLVKKFASNYENLDLTDEGAKYPLGGHIHIGIGRRIDPTRDLITILDDFIGRPTIDLSGKARGSYKNLGMTRSQPHGFEYRSTPASIFQEPMMTFIVFKLAKNLSERYFNQEDFLYNDAPTIEDYVKVGGLSEREAYYFMKFCNSYKPQKSIRASWKVKAAPVNEAAFRPISVEFHDDWSEENRTNLTNIINETIQLDYDFRITFYGLAQERGNCLCTIPVEGLSRYDGLRNTWPERHHLNIGVSYDLRKYGIPRSCLRNIVNSIQAMLSRREDEE